MDLESRLFEEDHEDSQDGRGGEPTTPGVLGTSPWGSAAAAAGGDAVSSTGGYVDAQREHAVGG